MTINDIKTPNDIEELKAQLNMLSEDNKSGGPDFRATLKTEDKVKKSLFTRLFHRR